VKFFPVPPKFVARSPPMRCNLLWSPISQLGVHRRICGATMPPDRISRFDMSCAQAHWVGSLIPLSCATNRGINTQLTIVRFMTLYQQFSMHRCYNLIHWAGIIKKLKVLLIHFHR